MYRCNYTLHIKQKWVWKSMFLSTPRIFVFHLGGRKNIRLLYLSLSLSLGIVVLKPVQMMMIIQHITSNAPTMRCSHHSFLPPIHSEIIPFIKQFMIFKPQFIPLSRGMYSTCSNLKDPLIHVITVYSRIFAYQYMLDVDGVNGNQRLWKR